MTILDVVIAGKDEASAAFESVDKSLGKLGSTAGTAVKIGMGVAVAGVAAVGTAAVAAGAAAFNLSSDIQNATNNIAAQMGISKDEAAGFEDVMTGIFANNFGDSFDDIGSGITTVTHALGEMPDDVLQGITEDAFALRDAFDMGVGESATGAKALVESFGVTGEQAMDLIAHGMQNGLNASGDFVESLGEYSNLFSEAGFSAEQMYNIMESGAQAGILGTDKIADAIKEMGIKLNEGTDETKAA
jgi:TP901 family phage tail tape measure protein